MAVTDTMAPDPAVSNRASQFGSGMIGGQATAPPSLAQRAQQYNAMVPRSVTPTGSLNGLSNNQYQTTLGGILPVGNGVNQRQYQETMGGRFRNPNGISDSNYQIQRYSEGAE